MFPYGNRLHIVNPSLLGLDISKNTKFRILDTNDNYVEAVVWNEFIQIPEQTITTEMKIVISEGTYKLVKNGI